MPGVPLHQDLLFRNNSVDSGPHPTFQLYRSHGVLIDQNRITTCGSEDAAAGGLAGLVVQVGGDADIVYDGNTNVVINQTSARLCTKRPALIRSANSSRVYFIDFRYEAKAVEIAARTLHPLFTCMQCGVNVCESMGVSVVSDSFLAARVVGSRFACAMLPGPRVIRCPGSGEMFFQPSPGSPAVYTVIPEVCAQCPGVPCANETVVPVDAAFCATLQPGLGLFTCDVLTS